MTKKHFIAIASALQAGNASLKTCEMLADVFRQLNPRFDRRSFLDACGYDPLGRFRFGHLPQPGQLSE